MKKIIRKNILYYVPLVLIYVLNIIISDSFSESMGWICCIILTIGISLNSILYEKRIKNIKDTINKFYEKHKEKDNGKKKKD